MTIMARPTAAFFSSAAPFGLDPSELAVAPLGAHLDGASAETCQAAIERSRRVPEPGEVRAAWHTLPAAVRDQIGEAALLHAFYVIASDTDGRELVLAVAHRCESLASSALTRSMVLAEEALPDLFGTAEAEPAWTFGRATDAFMGSAE